MLRAHFHFHSLVAFESEASPILWKIRWWSQTLALIAEASGLTDGETDVQSHVKITETSYLMQKPLLMEMRWPEKWTFKWTLMGEELSRIAATSPLFFSKHLLLSQILKQLLLIRQENHFEILKRDKGRACVWRETLGFHPVTHGCLARVSHLRQIVTHVRLTHAQEAIHKFSVKPL